MNTNLQLVIAKLELKQLEVIDSLSKGHDNTFIIRCVTDPKTNKILAINGDWETVTGFNEIDCIGEDWVKFLGANEDVDTNQSFDENGFSNYNNNVKTIDGDIMVAWTSKSFPEIDAIVSIGKVPKTDKFLNLLRTTKNSDKKRELMDFFENNNVPMHQVNSDGIIVRANKAELDSLGYTKKEYIGKPISNFHKDQDVISDILVKLINNEDIWKQEAAILGKNGKVVNVSITSSRGINGLTRCISIPK